jgi:hypothetical protein
MLRGVFLKEICEMQSSTDTQRRVCSLGLINIFGLAVTQSEPYLSLWPAFVTGVFKCMETLSAQKTGVVNEEPYLLDVEEAGYQAGFVQLSAIGRKVVDVSSGIDLVAGFKGTLGRAPGNIMQGIDEKTREKLAAL